MKEILIHTEYIELQSLLKLCNIIQTGGEAKFFLKSEEVFVNDEPEQRRGKKIYPGDQVRIRKETYLIKRKCG